MIGWILLGAVLVLVLVAVNRFTRDSFSDGSDEHRRHY